MIPGPKFQYNNHGGHIFNMWVISDSDYSILAKVLSIYYLKINKTKVSLAELF
jgi:hypothetical protein